jgi:hypothetical protein
MLQAAVAVLFIGLVYGFFVDRVTPEYQLPLFLLMPLLCFAAIAWAFVPERKRRR